MKKLIKACGVLLLLVCLSGLALAAAAGTEKGAELIEKAVTKITDGRTQIDTNDWREWGDSVGEEVKNTLNGLSDLKPDLNYEISDTGYFDEAHETLSGDIEKYSLGSEICNLDMDVGGCMLAMHVSEDENFYVQVKNAGKFQGYTEGNTLYIRYVTSSQKSDALDGCKITLWVPAGHVFDKAEIEVGAGLLECGELRGGEISLEVGAGQITVEELISSDTEISVGMGYIELQQLKADRLSADIGMGRFQAEGSVEREAEIECSMGDVSLKLAGKQEDFNYDLEGAMGNVSVGNDNYSGFSRKKTIANDAQKNVTVECSMGNVSINFVE